MQRPRAGAGGRPASSDHEVLLGTDESHLDFRASVLVEPHRVVLSTAVRLHGARGRAHDGLVRPVHPVVVRTVLARAAHRLAIRPAAEPARPGRRR